MKFRFKIVRTEFHSGRLMVTFSPKEAGLVNTSVTYPTTSYLNREIYDIRMCNEFEVIVPYICQSPYRTTTDSADSIGTLDIWIANQLESPDTVSSSVKIIVEVAGGEDMEFAIPYQYNNKTAVTGLTPQSGLSKEGPNDCSLSRDNIGASNVVQNELNSGFCVGEKVTSFRTLIKQPNLLIQTSSTYTSDHVTFSYVPYAFPVYEEATTPINPIVNTDLYTTLCSIYALSRGGVRFKAFARTQFAETDTDVVKNFGVTAYSVPTPSSGQFNAMYKTSPSQDFYLTDPRGYSSGNRAYFDQSSGELLQVQIPQYSRYHSRANADHMCSTNNAYALGGASMATRLFVVFQWQGSKNPIPQIFRSGSDDVNFGAFVSIPPMTGVASAIG